MNSQNSFALISIDIISRHVFSKGLILGTQKKDFSISPQDLAYWINMIFEDKDYN